MQHICKYFPGVKAVDNVDFTVGEREIHGLVGENGAGKSTLMNLLFGLLQPDSGTIQIAGEDAHISSPEEAMHLGIGMVHQHFMLVPSLSVIQNIVLGNPARDRIVVKYQLARKRVQEIMERYALHVDLDAKVYQLSVGEKQRVEIIKALYRNVRILILDEPTAVLTPQETEKMIGVLTRLRDDGCSIVFITHKLKEVLSVASRITVMRKGVVTGQVDAVDTTERELSNMMIGRVVNDYLERAPYQPGEEVLRTEDVCCVNERGLPAVKQVSLSVHRGEVVGIAGVEGNGQTELVELITGLSRVQSGRVYLMGQDITHTRVRKRRKAGMSHIPEDRLKTGASKNCTVEENIILNRYYSPPLSHHGFLSKRACTAFAARLVKQFAVKVPNAGYRLGTLSGGNMQKVILAREIEADPALLVAAQPTRGVDIGAIEYIHGQLLALRDSGKAILLVSAELNEVMALSDRVLVLYEGRIVAEFRAGEVSETELGLYMAGAKTMYGEGAERDERTTTA